MSVCLVPTRVLAIGLVFFAYFHYAAVSGGGGSVALINVKDMASILDPFMLLGNGGG